MPMRLSPYQTLVPWLSLQFAPSLNSMMIQMCEVGILQVNILPSHLGLELPRAAVSLASSRSQVSKETGKVTSCCPSLAIGMRNFVHTAYLAKHAFPKLLLKKNQVRLLAFNALRSENIKLSSHLRDLCNQFG